MNPNVHDPHDWAIGANPGEDGPDWFRCDGRRTALVPWSARGEIPLGRVDTSGPGWTPPAQTVPGFPAPDWRPDALAEFDRLGEEWWSQQIADTEVETRLCRATNWTPDTIDSLIGQTAPAYGLDAIGITADTVTVVDARIENGWVIATLRAND
jgi:hypothetical protein